MNRSTVKWVIGGVVALAALLLLWKGFYIVRPDQFALKTKFGEIVEVIATCDKDGHNCKPKPGLYFKWPFIEDVRYMDARVRGWNSIMGRDKKTKTQREIDFIAFARWRISDPEAYYKAHIKSNARKTEQAAQGSMDSIIGTRIEDSVRQHRLVEIVRESSRKFETKARLNLRKLVMKYGLCNPDSNAEIVKEITEAQKSTERKDTEDGGVTGQRSRIVQLMRKSANKELQKGFGIRIYDLHFKYLNYSQKIHAKMIQEIIDELQQDIEAYRRLGRTCRGIIDQTKLEQVGQIEGDRDRRMRQIGGSAVAKAIEIKARAFNQGPEFFRFLKMLEVYEAGLGSNTSLVIGTDSPLLALLKDPTLVRPVKPLSGLKPLRIRELDGGPVRASEKTQPKKKGEKPAAKATVKAKPKAKKGEKKTTPTPDARRGGPSVPGRKPTPTPAVKPKVKPSKAAAKAPKKPGPRKAPPKKTRP